MDRLTFEGDFCTIAMCREQKCPYDGSCSQREVWDRLKAYEDTGLEPEEVAALREQESNCPEIEAIKGVEIDQVKTGWIPVTERLPEVGMVVLVYSEDDGVSVDYHGGDSFGYALVTHWMPLPEPPKEG